MKIRVLRSKLLSRLRFKDHYEFFEAPVNPLEVPDYAGVIHDPRDYGTMTTRLEAGEYDADLPNSKGTFARDLLLVCDNAMEYNDDESMYYREAQRLKKETKAGLRTLFKRIAEVHAANPPPVAAASSSAAAGGAKTSGRRRRVRVRARRSRAKRGGGGGTKLPSGSRKGRGANVAQLKEELKALRAAAAASKAAAVAKAAQVQGMMVQAHATIRTRSIASLQTLLRRIEKNDHYAFFADPVDTTVAIDYLTVVREPMDFSTMRRRLLAGEYSPAPHGRGIEAMERDVALICSNCMAYNPPTTEFHREAKLLIPHAEHVFKAYRDRVLRVSGGKPSLPSSAARMVVASDELAAAADADDAAVQDAERRLDNMQALELASSDRRVVAAAAAASAAAAANAAAAREAEEAHELARWWVDLDREYFCCSENQRRALLKLASKGTAAANDALLSVPPVGAPYELRWALEDRSAKHRVALQNSFVTPIFDGYDTARFLEIHQDHTEGASLDVAVLSSLADLGDEDDHPLSRATFRFADIDDAEALASVNTVNKTLYNNAADFEERLRAKNDFFIVIEEELANGKGRQITAFVNYYFMWFQVSE